MNHIYAALSVALTSLTTLIYALSKQYKINEPMPEPSPLPPEPQPIPPSKADLLYRMCEAIEDFEGMPGDLNYINNNPGNLRCTPWMNKLAASKDARGFCVFTDHATGMQALRNMILNVANGKSTTYNNAAKKLKKPSGSELTLNEFFHIYTSDPEPSPTNYAISVAKRMGTTPDFQLGELV